MKKMIKVRSVLKQTEKNGSVKYDLTIKVYSAGIILKTGKRYTIVQDDNVDPESNVHPFRPSIHESEMYMIKGTAPNFYFFALKGQEEQTLAIMMLKVEKWILDSYYMAKDAKKGFEKIDRLFTELETGGFLDYYESKTKDIQNQKS